MAAIVVSLPFTSLSPKALQDVLEDVVIKLSDVIICECRSRIWVCTVISNPDKLYCCMHKKFLKNMLKLDFQTQLHHENIEQINICMVCLLNVALN